MGLWKSSGHLVRSPATSMFALLAAMVSFTSGASLAESLFAHIGPEGATTLRLVGGALMLSAVGRPWRSGRPASSSPIVVYGLAMAGMNLLFYKALATVPLGIAVALEFSGPLAVTIWSSRAAADLVWVGLAICGVALLSPVSGSLHNVDPLGMAEALGAGVCWAVYILSGKRAGQAHGSAATALGMSLGALAVMPFGVAHAGTALLLPAVLLPGLGVALLSSALPYSLEMFALRRLRVKTYGTLMSCEPAIGAIAGLCLLGQALTSFQVLGISLIVASAAGTTIAGMDPSRSRKVNDAITPLYTVRK